MEDLWHIFLNDHAKGVLVVNMEAAADIDDFYLGLINYFYGDVLRLDIAVDETFLVDRVMKMQDAHEEMPENTGILLDEAKDLRFFDCVDTFALVDLSFEVVESLLMVDPLTSMTTHRSFWVCWIS